MKLRYTKAERLRKTAAETVLSDSAATSADRMAAVRTLERLESAARRRAEEREWNLPEPAPAPEPTVDDLVSALEKAEKAPLQVQQNKGPENAPIAVNAVSAPSEPAKALEVTQTVPEAPTAFCGFCSAAGAWNTRYPVGQADGILLCPACFGRMCAADMRNASALAKFQAEQPADWADPFNAQRNVSSSDYQRSVEIWHQQAAQDADRQAEERAERDRAEAQYHTARARWIQDGGRL